MDSLAGTQLRCRKEEQEDDDDDDAGSFSHAMCLAMGSVLPLALQAAVELGVFKIIAKGGLGAKMSVSDIVSKMPNCNNPDAPLMLDRILRLLASNRVLVSYISLGSERLYGLAPVAKYFVPDEDGVSLGPFIAMMNDNVFLESWPELKMSVLEGGIPFNRFHGMHIFEYPEIDSRFGQVFNRAMKNHATIVMKKVLEVYKGFNNITQLVDVGGGLGITLSLITSKYPHIKGINFDLPHVIEHAPIYPGVEHVGGDMFESVPNGDAIFMKCVMHDWADEECSSLLKKCHEAIPENGKVISMNQVLTVNVETSASAKDASNMDLTMMTQTHKGKERTREEFLALAVAAGFSGIRYECFVCNYWVMEFYK